MKEDEEKKGLLEKEKEKEKGKKDDKNKEKEPAKEELHASRALEFEGEEDKKKEEEKKEKTLTESATDMSFLQSKWKRFLGGLILFVVADLTDHSFKTIWKLRDRNNLGYLLLVMLAV
jgi:hypothetical protein